MSATYEAAVVGAGPAGLTAALFLARRGRTVALLDEFLGNHMTNAGQVENFPGFPAGIEGPDLSALLQQQALDAGALFVPAKAESLAREDGGFEVTTSSGPQRARTVLLCIGSSHRLLGIDGEARLTGCGISHCATCDGPLFRNRDVVVVGGGDAAVDSALVLSPSAASVTVVHRGPTLRAQHALRERLHAAANVRVLLETEPVRFEGSTTLEALTLRNVPSRRESRLVAQGAFILAGLEPNTCFLRGVVELDMAGHIVTDHWLETTVSGIFAAGDARVASARQFVSAAGDGATAAIAADRFLGLRRP